MIFLLMLIEIYSFVCVKFYYTHKNYILSSINYILCILWQ